MTLGTLIKRARKARKLSLEALGEKLGVSRQLVWQWEKGDTDARKHVQALSKALEMPVDYFYGGERSTPPLEAKIRLLTPENQETIEMMVDRFLQQQEPPTVPAKKA